jgi:hypothetical protein
MYINKHLHVEQPVTVDKSICRLFNFKLQFFKLLSWIKLIRARFWKICYKQKAEVRKFFFLKM